jgi:hypothetical protein
MKKSLQNQYQLIKEGKGQKDIFLKEAKSLFPNYLPNSVNFNQAVNLLKDKNIISENIVSVGAINHNVTPKESFELDFERFLKEEKEKEDSEKVKAIETKPIEQYNIHDNSDSKNVDNVIFDQLMAGYYIEMKKPKNCDKTIEEIKDIVLKNLQKDPIFYVTKGQFGLEDVGYEVELPGLGTPKEPKGPHKSSGYGNLNEAIQLSTIISPGQGKQGGKRFVPNIFPLPKITAKRFGDHIVYNNGKLYISSILHNNLIKGYTNQPAIKKLIIDLPPMVKQILNKTESYGNLVQLPKEFKNYLPLKYEVTRATEDKFNKDRSKQYWAEGDILIPNPKKGIEEEANETMNIKESQKYVIVKGHPSGKYKIASVSKYDNRFGKYTTSFKTREEAEEWLKNNQKTTETNETMNIQEQKLRKIIRNLIKEELTKSPLNENLDKRLKEIEGESQLEALQNKINKIGEEIEKRNSQLGMLDENEDLSELLDKNAVKKIQKEIKLLEKAKEKYSKMCEKMGSKGAKKEVIDENEDDEFAQAEQMYDTEYQKNGTVDIESIADNFPGMEEDILNHLEGYTIDTDSEY